jgi:hypothetical protein
VPAFCHEVASRQIRHRSYHSQLGRHIGRDPVGYGDGYSLYRAAFVPNGTDPSAMIRISCECMSTGWGPPSPFTVTVECSGLASNCCRGACGYGYHWTGRWTIVPGRDAYDDALDDFNTTVAEIVICCLPVPAAKCAQVAFRTVRCTVRVIRVSRWGSPIKSGT